jgi:hypothetical protein
MSKGEIISDKTPCLVNDWMISSLFLIPDPLYTCVNVHFLTTDKTNNSKSGLLSYVYGKSGGSTSGCNNWNISHQTFSDHFGGKSS